MSVIDDRASVTAFCTNEGNCTRAEHADAIEWYPGPGEYCPECGEALTAAPPQLGGVEAATKGEVTHPSSLPAVVEPLPPTEAQPRIPYKRRLLSPLRWFWLIAAVCFVGAGAMYAERHDVPLKTTSPNTVSICPLANARQFAADLVNAYAAKNRLAANRFSIVDAHATHCDVRFSTGPQLPEAVVARDGIVAVVNPLNPVASLSVEDVRGIFSGTIRDWSQLGGPHGPIVALLPDANSDEAKALASGLLFGLPIGHGVARGGSSWSVTRTVSGADRRAGRTIGLVAFSQASSGKVVPLSYLPPPTVLTIASRYYPYTLTIAVRAGTRRHADTVAGLIRYARSNAGTAIIQKNGLVPSEGQ